MYTLPDNRFHSKKIVLPVIIMAVAIIIVASLFCFKRTFNRQVEHLYHQLENQARHTGKSVDYFDSGFRNDLGQLIFSENIRQFISEAGQRARTIDKMKLLFAKYEDLVTGIRIHDDKKNEFTLKKDNTGNNWLEQFFVLHVTSGIVPRDTLVMKNKTFDYYIPLKDGGNLAGNIVVSLDYQKYFNSLLSPFYHEGYHWQWVVDPNGQIIYSNNRESIKSQYLLGLSGKSGLLANDGSIHSALINGKNRDIISFRYSTKLLERELSIVFFSPVSQIKSGIGKNAFFTGSISILMVLLVSLLLSRLIRVQEEEAGKILSSRQNLREIIDEMPVGIVIHDGKGEILTANSKAAELYSFDDKESMVGSIFPETAHTDETDYFVQHLGGNFSPDQFIVLRKDNEDIILLRSRIPISYKDQKAVMETLADVTALESARKQEASASSAKSDFLARMSYELRTPLNGIIGMTDILEKRYVAGEAADILKLLRRSSEVLLGIINDILDFSKIESGKLILDEILFNLREEIMYCYDLARTNSDSARVEISSIIDSSIPDKVIGDPFRLRQVLTNYLNNSLSNTKEGKIILECSLDDYTEGRIRLFFRISDTGRTFDSDTLKKMFGSHVRIESKAARESDESGFGLILARQLIELMDGELEVQSPSGIDKDSGTRVEFTISLWSNEKLRKSLENDSLTSFCQIRTLAVTGSHNRDEEILGTLHKLGLAMTVNTYQKSTVNQLRASLGIPEKKYHLIVILDENGFNGFDAAREIHEHNLSEKFVIIMITSNDKTGNLIKCSSFRIDHYIVKPFDIKELYENIKSSFPNVDAGIRANEGERAARNLKILVVEDNKMNQQVIGTMLKSLGYSFDFADDGFAGFIQAKTRRYDVIFMDLIMPQMDGFESARKILEYDSSLLIVAFTADNMPESKRKAELSGIREFIPKPVRIEDLKKFFARNFYCK